MRSEQGRSGPALAEFPLSAQGAGPASVCSGVVSAVKESEINCKQLGQITELLLPICHKCFTVWSVSISQHIWIRNSLFSLLVGSWGKKPLHKINHRVVSKIVLIMIPWFQLELFTHAVSGKWGAGSALLRCLGLVPVTHRGIHVLLYYYLLELWSRRNFRGKFILCSSHCLHRKRLRVEKPLWSLWFLLEKLLFFLFFLPFLTQIKNLGVLLQRPWALWRNFPLWSPGLGSGTPGKSSVNPWAPDPAPALSLTLSSSQERLRAQVSRIKWFVCFNSDFLRVLRNHWAGVEPLSSAEVYNSCYFSPLPSRQEQCPVSVLSVQWLSSGQMLQIFSSKLEIPPHRKADCACGKGIQLDPTVEIKEWEGPCSQQLLFFQLSLHELLLWTQKFTFVSTGVICTWVNPNQNAGKWCMEKTQM